MIFKTILEKNFSAKTQWFLLQIEWGIHFFWSHDSEKSTFFRILTFLWLSALISHFFDWNGHIFTYFEKNVNKKFFYPKQSDFGRKLHEESISFGRTALKKSVFSEFGLFIKMSKRDFFREILMFKRSLEKYFSPKQWFRCKIEWGIHFSWSKGSMTSLFSEFGLFHSHFSLF